MLNSQSSYTALAALVAVGIASCVTTTDVAPKDVPALVALSAKDDNPLRYMRRGDRHFVFAGDFGDEATCKRGKESGIYLCPDGIKEATDVAARKLHEQLCSKTSSKNLNAHVTAVLPKTVEGLPLDVAQAQQKTMRETIKNAVKSFFLPLSFRYPEYRPTSPRWKLPSDKPNDLVRHFKSQEFDLQKNASNASETDLYSFYEVGGKVFLTLSPYVWKPELLTCSRAESFLYKNLPSDQIGCRVSNLAETSQLMSRYTIMQPGASPSDAVEQKDNLWVDYIHTYTSATEAQNDDPQVITYDLTLNLKRFCEYGANVDDLKSKGR